MVLVVILAFSFVAIVLIPGLELASELADSSLGAQIRWASSNAIPPLIRASLESMHDRLATRGYIQESLDQLRDASGKLDAGLQRNERAAAGELVRAVGRHRRDGRTDRRKARRGVARPLGQGKEALEPVARIHGRALPGQRSDRHRAQRERQATGARRQRGDAHQPARAAAARQRIDGDRRRTADRQCTIGHAAAARHADGPADRAWSWWRWCTRCCSHGNGRKPSCARRVSRPPTFCAPSRTACSCSTRISSSARPTPARWNRCFSATTSPGCISRICSRTSCPKRRWRPP